MKLGGSLLKGSIFPPVKVRPKWKWSFSKGVIIQGPPGSGKTLLVRTVSEMFDDVKFFFLNSYSFLSKVLFQNPKSLTQKVCRWGRAKARSTFWPSSGQCSVGGLSWWCSLYQKEEKGICKTQIFFGIYLRPRTLRAGRKEFCLPFSTRWSRSPTKIKCW